LADKPTYSLSDGEQEDLTSLSSFEAKQKNALMRLQLYANKKKTIGQMPA
jgi:hypothetical protein